MLLYEMRCTTPVPNDLGQPAKPMAPHDKPVSFNKIVQHYTAVCRKSSYVPRGWPEKSRWIATTVGGTRRRTIESLSSTATVGFTVHLKLEEQQIHEIILALRDIKGPLLHSKLKNAIFGAPGNTSISNRPRSIGSTKKLTSKRIHPEHGAICAPPRRHRQSK